MAASFIVRIALTSFITESGKNFSQNVCHIFNLNCSRSKYIYIFEKNIIRWFANSIFHSSKYWKNRVSLCIDWKVFANNGLWHKRGEQLWLSFYEIIYLSPNDTTHPPMSGLIIHNHPNFTNRTWFWNAYSFVFQHVSVFPMTSFR